MTDTQRAAASAYLENIRQALAVYDARLAPILGERQHTFMVKPFYERMMKYIDAQERIIFSGKQQ